MAGAREIRAGRAAVEIGITDRFSAGLRKAQERLSAFGAGVAKIGAGLTIAGTALAAPLAAATKIFADQGDQLEKMSQRTGIAVESLSALKFAAEQSGTSLDDLEKGVRKMQQTIVDADRGLATANEGFDELGISVDKLIAMSPEDQFLAVADALSRVEDPTKRAAIAMQIFGRAGTQLLPLILEGTDGIRRLREQAEELGLVMSSDAAKSAALLGDTMDILRSVLNRTAQVVGEALAPAIVKVIDLVVPLVVGMNRLIKNNKGLVVALASVAAGLLALGGTLLFIGTSAIVLGFALGGLASAVGVATTVFGAFAAAVAAILSPIGLAVAAVVGLGVAILKWSGLGERAITFLGDRFGELGRFIGSVASGVANALAAGDLQLAARVLWAGLRVAWETGANELNGIWLTVRNFFITNAQRMWYGAKAAFVIFSDALGIDWVSLVAFLQSTLTKFGAGFKTFWEGLTGFVAKRIVDLQGLFDETVDTGALKAEIDLQTSERQAQIEAEKQASLFEIQEQREARSGETLEQSLARIGTEFEAAQAALDKATGDSVASAQRDLDEARKALSDAIADAQQKRDDLPGGGRFGRSLGDFASELDGVLSGVQERVSVEGTFSAFAAGGFGVSGDAEARTAQSAERIERVVKNIENLTRGLNLAFGGG